ncbi:carbohydrate-binding module family 32 [Hyaloscypha bicolor E]|uniref:Carbohydrate-binding module family 32 n=1 Tax=Hyaloscypha bicolor E TaxID=1095630 RepID=A0A2J6SZR6_9HELO|nr:carbohydrate-binding module family 32 [Hyaloscypha bicolor E]PMD56242.1 carbohydrate-binding module family 32 [Hyaloscypha bicolor E]
MKPPYAQLLLGVATGAVVANATGHYLQQAMNGERVSGYAYHDVPTWEPSFSNESPPLNGHRVPRENWSLSCSSSQRGYECNKVIDGKNTTDWRSDTGQEEHSITIDLKIPHSMNAIVILPPINTGLDGLITHHEVHVSDDGKKWRGPIAYGMWPESTRQRMSIFDPVPARYLKLTTRGADEPRKSWVGISELNIYATTYTIPQDPARGAWGPTVDFPVIPVAGAQEPSGRVVVWSSWASDQFHSTPGGQTAMSQWNPLTREISQRVVTNTHHDMFCPGIAIDGTGMLIVTGGNDATVTSLYDSEEDQWFEGPAMHLRRGYQSTTTLSDGRVFVIGGSWAGGSNIPKDGEVYDPAARNWTMLPGAKVKPMLTDDMEGAWRADNHGWLFGWKNLSIFQAGPSVAMNWYYAAGSGDVKKGGKRMDDDDSMSGNAVMFDAVKGKILTVGGSPDYESSWATANAHIITLGEPGEIAKVELAGKNGTMHSERVFHTSTVLPDGKVFIVGGQTFGIAFNEEHVQFVPELYDPVTNTFTQLQQSNFARVYHHLSILLPDARVLTAGGGLCGNCSANHYDGQIFTPPYLLTARGEPRPRPRFAKNPPRSARVGGTIAFATAAKIASASLVRLCSTSHTVNTDQRRVPLTLSRLWFTNSYTARLPTDPGILIPGPWMLFVMDRDGVPSFAQTIMVTVDTKKSAGLLDEEEDEEEFSTMELVK